MAVCLVFCKALVFVLSPSDIVWGGLMEAEASAIGTPRLPREVHEVSTVAAKTKTHTHIKYAYAKQPQSDSYKI